MSKNPCPNHATQRKIELTSFNSNIEIIVGPGDTKFTFHKNVLFEIASYIRAALGGHFQESLEQRIVLSEEEVETFPALPTVGKQTFFECTFWGISRASGFS